MPELPPGQARTNWQIPSRTTLKGLMTPSVFLDSCSRGLWTWGGRVEGLGGRQAGAGRLAALNHTCLVCMLNRFSCVRLCDPIDCSPPASSVHGILQARILEWVAIPFSRGSSWSRDQTWVSCIAGRILTMWAAREALTLLQFKNGYCEKFYPDVLCLVTVGEPPPFLLTVETVRQGVETVNKETH